MNLRVFYLTRRGLSDGYNRPAPYKIINGDTGIPSLH